MFVVIFCLVTFISIISFVFAFIRIIIFMKKSAGDVMKNINSNTNDKIEPIRPKSKICEYCGSQIKNGASSCDSCGANTKGE